MQETCFDYDLNRISLRAIDIPLCTCRAIDYAHASLQVMGAFNPRKMMLFALLCVIKLTHNLGDANEGTNIITIAVTCQATLLAVYYNHAWSNISDLLCAHALT